MSTYYEKNKKKMKAFFKTYYEKHREEILKKYKDNYFNTKKKTARCQICGYEFPKEVQGNTKYCDRCLYSRGHGEQAHRLAAVRYLRKKKLDKQTNK